MEFSAINLPLSKYFIVVTYVPEARFTKSFSMPIPICWESMNLFWEETEAVRQVAGAKWFIKHFTSPDRDR